MASVYDIIHQATSALGDNTDAMQAAVLGQKNLANQNIELAQGAVADSQLVSDQRNAGMLQAQENANRVKQGLGNDPNDPNSLLSILVQDFREKTTTAREQAAAISAKKQVSLFDDLPQFLVNQITLPDDINAYKGTLGELEVAKDGIATMQSLTTASAQAEQATKQVLSKDSIRAQSEVDAAKLASAINDMKSAALGYDLEGIKLTNAANAQQVQLAVSEHSMRLQDAAALRASEEWAWKLEQKKESEAELSRYAEKVSIGAKSHGLPEMGFEEIKARAKFGTSQQKAQLDKLYEQGNYLISAGFTSANAGSAPVGSTPGEAIWNALTTGGLKNEQNKPAREYLQRIYDEVIAQYPPNTKITPEVERRIQSQINDRLYGPVSNAKTGKRSETLGELYKMASDMNSPTSIYKAPDLNNLVNIPSIKTNPLYESVILPAVKAGVTKSDPEAMYAQAREAVARGAITENQLVIGLADFYKTVTAATYTSSGAGKFGLPYRPSYITKMDDPMGLGKLQLDWAKESNWIMYNTSKQAAGALAKSLPQGGFMGVGVR